MQACGSFVKPRSLVLIRPATHVDLPLMRELEQQSETAAHWAERDYEALFAPEAPQRLALVAVEGADAVDVCGFLVARCSSDEWEIENVVVRPNKRRRGIGSAIVAELVQRARAARARSVLLEVRESNLAGRRLYEKLGFSQTGMRSGYYREPLEAALLLKVSISVL